VASGARPIFSSVNRSGAFQVVLELMLPVAPIDTGGEFLGHPTTGQKTNVAARPVQIGLRALVLAFQIVSFCIIVALDGQLLNLILWSLGDYSIYNDTL